MVFCLSKMNEICIQMNITDKLFRFEFCAIKNVKTYAQKQLISMTYYLKLIDTLIMKYSIFHRPSVVSYYTIEKIHSIWTSFSVCYVIEITPISMRKNEWKKLGFGRSRPTFRILLTLISNYFVLWKSISYDFFKFKWWN